MVLASRLRNWRNTILLVKPETVVRCHQEGFRLFWKSRSRPKSPDTPRLATDTVELIRRMAVENRTWGAERIRGELLKLGIRVTKRTIQRHIRAVRPPGDGQRWRTFLRNYTVWACDFLQVYDIWFRPVFAFMDRVLTKGSISAFPLRPRRTAPVPADGSLRSPCSVASTTTTGGRLDMFGWRREPGHYRQSLLTDQAMLSLIALWHS